MADDEVVSADESRPFLNPWPTLAVGMVSAVGAFLLAQEFGAANEVVSGARLLVCLLLILVGLLAAGVAVVMQPRWAPVIAGSAFIALLASLVMDAAGWDSLRLLCRVLAVFAGVSAVVVLLPQTAQRTVVSLLILFHFGGILSAITNVSPSPWVSQQLWTYVYRPYLQFLYMNNAYHFYSPNPGPASMMWFHIEYERKDGKRYTRLVKVPELDDDGRTLRPDGRLLWPRVEYTRRLSLCESINMPGSVPYNYQQLQASRLAAGEIKHIPPHPGKLLAAQYSEPPVLARKWISSYVRYVARTFKHQEHPELQVIGVKLYRVVHDILDPYLIAAGWDPNDPSTYSPYYLGEYDKEGNLKESSLKFELDEKGEWREARRDPFLYWIIPITWEWKDKAHPPPNGTPPTKENADFKDYFSIQTMDQTTEGLP